MQCRMDRAHIRSFASMIHQVSKIRALIRGCNIYNDIIYEQGNRLDIILFAQRQVFSISTD